MAEKNNLTSEEIRAKQVSNSKKTLDNKFFQDVLGSNKVKGNPFLYGELGQQSANFVYGESLNGAEAQEVRKKIYGVKKQQGDNLGVFGEPSVTNYDVSLEIIKQVEENKFSLSIGELENVVKGIVGDLGVEIPSNLKDYVPLDIINRTQGDNEKLTEAENEAFATYQALSGIYDRGVSLKIVQKGYFTDLINPLKKIAEKYKAKETD